MIEAFKRWPLARQLWLLLVTPTAAALALYGFFAHQNRQRVLLDAAAGELRNYASLVEASLAVGADPSAPGPMRSQLEALARADRVLGLAGYDARGHALAVTTDVLAASEVLAPIAQRALEGGADVVDARVLARGPTLVRTVTVRSPSGAPPYAIVIVLDLGYISELSASLDRGLVVTSAVVIAAIALLTAWTSRRMVGDPVGAIVEGANRIAAGELDARVPAHGAREIAQLGRAFNVMGERLEGAREDARAHAAHRAAIERRLRDSQALAAAGQIAASVAHEIGSPLNVILGRARRGADHAACPDPIRRELDAIASQSERITRVVSGLLTLARPRGHAPGADLAAAARAAVDFVAPEARQRGVRLKVEVPDRAIQVAVGEDALFQIIFNLVMNAIQAPSVTRLTVRLAAGDDAATLEVEDDGAGVPPEDAARIFDAFYTTKADAGGSGLGLAIVTGILREAGGEIALDAARASGALFRARIPLREEGPAKRARRC